MNKLLGLNELFIVSASSRYFVTLYFGSLESFFTLENDAQTPQNCARVASCILYTVSHLTLLLVHFAHASNNLSVEILLLCIISEKLYALFSCLEPPHS